jgi:hypothetical protein
VRRRGSLLLAALAGCSPREAPPAAPVPARYLYVWAGTGHGGGGSNFIAVVDVRPESPAYGQIVAASPAIEGGMMPHHTEFVLPASGKYFANDFMAGKNFLVDASSPQSPRVTPTPAAASGFRGPHSFKRLDGSHVLMTLQFGDSTRAGNPGGLALVDSAGNVLRASSSFDSAFPNAAIRTYAIEALPGIDRVLTTSSPMDSEHTADVVQIWRLSDLTLLETIPMPGIPGDSVERYPFEVRALEDGKTLLLNTYYCGFYRIAGLDLPEPTVELVHTMREPRRIGCSVPLVRGKFWVMPIAYAHTIVTLDVSDPAHPMEVSAFPTDSSFFPHWVAADPGSDRLVVSEQGDGPPRILMVRLDPATGRLSWDERFQEADSTARGVSFSRARWPNGLTGHAMPHGALFVP